MVGANKKIVKVIPMITPGSEIIIKCRNSDQGCEQYFTIKPSSDEAFPGKFSFVCGACGGVVTKWRMPEENAEEAHARVPGQKTLDSAVTRKEEE